MKGRALNVARLRDLLDGETWIASVTALRSVDSTNDEIRRLAQRGAPAGTVVVADAQTAGRGRRGRSWISTPCLGLYVSVLFRPAGAVALPARWTLAGAVAAARACRRAGAAVTIKWPNDLLWRGRKLGGVLAEMRSSGGRVGDLVIGTGLNVLHRDEDFPPDVGPLAVSLADATAGHPPERETLAGLYLHELGLVAAGLEGGEWETVSRAWEELSPDAQGRRVRVEHGEDDDGAYEGITGGLAPDGALRVTRDDGRVATVRLAGSVRHVEG